MSRTTKPPHNSKVLQTQSSSSFFIQSRRFDTENESSIDPTMGYNGVTDYEQMPQDANFVKIGNALTDRSNPNIRKTKQSPNVPASSHYTSTPVNTNRLFYLRVIDSRRWHYSETFALFIDFFVQILAISFTRQQIFADEILAKASRAVSLGLSVCYFIDMTFRILGLKSALFRSHSNVADLGCLLGMVTTLLWRWMYPKKEFYFCLAYLLLVAFRLILKPRARTFSKKFHKFRANGDAIRISIQSLRSSLARIPGISALAIEMMETDLVIICGRDEGDMTGDELMQFLERALHYRPHNVSATEFLAFLRDIGTSSSHLAYGMADVIQSTLWHWSNQSVDMIWCCIVVCVNAAISPALAYFLDQLSSAFDTLSKPELDEKALHYGIIGILGICIPFVLGDYAIGYFQSKMISKATERMQSSLLACILRQGTQFFADRSEGDLNNLFSSDVARVNALWQAIFWNLLNPLVAILFGFGYALIVDYSIGIMAFAFSAVLLSSGPQGFASHRSKEFGSKNAYVAAEFQNAIACQKVIRAYNIQNPLLLRFQHTCSQLRKHQFSKDFWSSIVQIYVESAMYIFTSIMMASLAIRVWRGELTSGRFFGFVTLLGRVSNPVTILGGFMRVAIGNASSLQRIDEIILGLEDQDETDDQSNEHNLPPIPTMEKELCIDKITFRYDKQSDNFVLNELSATFPRGAYTCVVGPSGCGKSTLLACLMQFQEADEGSIRLDGHDIFNFSKRSFMEQIAVVFQDGGILNGTIYDNIRYGNMHATNEECEEAATAAECHFIKDLKDGFDTIVGQHATCNLSGGQAQRICLARALCRKPTILLLDEATSALDPETEASIVQTLENLCKDRTMTIISVTHRLATAENADIIFVLSKGCVAESGTYDELVQQGGLFYEMIHKVEKETTLQEEHAIRPSRFHGDSICARRDPSTVAISPRNDQMALQQFTRNLSSRAHDTNLGRAMSCAARNRYGKVSSRRRVSHTEGDAASHSSHVIHLETSNNSAPRDISFRQQQQQQQLGTSDNVNDSNKYFVL